MALTPKQKLFCIKYISNSYNGTKAYKETYPDSSYESCMVSSSRLLRNVQVKLYIEELIRMTMNSKGLTKDYIINSIIAIAEDKRAKNSDKLKGLEMLGRSLAMFKDNQSIELKAVTNASTTQELDDEYKAMLSSQSTVQQYTLDAPIDTINNNNMNNRTTTYVESKNETGGGESNPVEGSSDDSQ